MRELAVPPSLAVGLDLGTTSVSAVAVDERGHLLRRVTSVHEADVPGLPAGHAEQHPQRLWEAALDALSRLDAVSLGEPTGLGLTGQMHGVLLVDERNRPVSNLVTWQDRRANESPRPGDSSFLERFRDRCPAEAITRSGTNPAPGFLGVTLAVLAEREAIPAKAHRAVFLADWIAASLGRTEPVTDPSNAASSGLFDVVAGDWNEAMVTAAEFPRPLLPPVRESGIPLGELAAERAGLPAGVTVCNAIGDNPAAVLGSVPAGETTIQVNVGTGGQINWMVDEFVRVAGMDTRPLPIGRLMLVGAGLAGGDAFAWVARTAREWAAALGVEISLERVYERLAAGLEPDDADVDRDRLRCTPTFRGTRREPAARGSFANVSNDNFGLVNVARAVVQGIVDGFHDFHERAGDARPSGVTRIVGTGNALERNPLLVRRLEERFGLPVWTPTHAESAAYGAALLAGASTGLWPNLDAASARIVLVPARERAEKPA